MRGRFADEKVMLPEYPRTRHLPHRANAARDDLICTEVECKVIFESPHVVVEEKVDGASCGMTINGDEPVIRNRSHILRKGYSKPNSAAKNQFSRVWNWWYDNYAMFRALAEAGPYSVYGDWCYAQHGIEYDLLPSFFVTYDLYDYEAGKFMDSVKGKALLREIGFTTVPELHTGPVANWEQLEALANLPSPFTSKGPREGVYLKVSDGKWIVHRFKMVREDFKQGALWNDSVINKNTIKEQS